MHFFRPWHAYRHRVHADPHDPRRHSFGRRVDGFAHLLVARLSGKLDLDAGQQHLLTGWLAQLQRQRDALKGLARGAELSDLLVGERFAREPAQRLIDARLDALRAAGPGLVGAFAEFFDALDAEQRQALRLMMRRAGGGAPGHYPSQHAPTAAD